MVEIGISKKPSTGEYRVFWLENRKDDERKAYYTNDPIDAVETLLDISTRNEFSGIPTKISTSKLTTSLLKRYNESFGGVM